MKDDEKDFLHKHVRTRILFILFGKQSDYV